MKTILEFLQKKKIEKAIADSDYEAVDLGLSVRWASYNVGATKPEEPGLLFQWGRTDGYKYETRPHGFLPLGKYTTTSKTKYDGGSDSLFDIDDAAHEHMGDKWRLPTEEEIQELCELSSKWTQINGVNGYKITGENGNSIFMPAAGYYHNTLCKCYRYNDSGFYWTSSTKSDNGNHIRTLTFDDTTSPKCFFYDSVQGHSIRGVCE